MKSVDFYCFAFIGLLAGTSRAGTSSSPINTPASASHVASVGALDAGIDPNLSFSRRVGKINLDDRIAGIAETPLPTILPPEARSQALIAASDPAGIPPDSRPETAADTSPESPPLRQTLQPVLKSLDPLRSLALFILSPEAQAGDIFDSSLHLVHAPVSDAPAHAEQTQAFPAQLPAYTLEDKLGGAFPEREVREFVQILARLPHLESREAAQKALLLAENKGSSEVEALMSLRGLSFELSRRAIVIHQGLEELSVRASQGLYADYRGLRKSSHGKGADLSAFDHEYKNSEIQNDVPVVRQDKPYIYETKNFLQKDWGTRPEHWNQLLKYQAAIRSEKVVGASVEIRGGVHPPFLDWAMRENENPIPDIEIIYSLRLPSIAEYRFVLKPSASGNGLIFVNNLADCTELDLKIIRALRRALKKGTMKDILAFNQAPKQKASPKLRPLLDYPADIKTNRLFQEYERLWWGNLYRRLLNAPK